MEERLKRKVRGLVKVVFLFWDFSFSNYVVPVAHSPFLHAVAVPVKISISILSIHYVV